MNRTRFVTGFLLRGSAASAMLLLLWGVLGSAIEHTPPTAGLAINLLLFPAFMAMAAGMHELGHAIVGHVAGLRVVRVSVGVGSLWASFKLGRTEIRLHELPLGGMTWLVPKSPQGLRWRMWFAVAGGPATNAVVVGATFLALGADPSSLFIHDGVSVLATWMVAHAGVLIISLIPGHVPRDADLAVSDGYALLEIPLMTEPEKDRLVAAGQAVVAREAFEQRDLQRAFDVCEAGLRIDPDSVALRNLQGCVLMEKREFEHAWEIFAELLNRPGLNRSWRDMLRSNLAWSALRLGKESILREAFHHSEQVFRRKAEAHWARTTHGAVLVKLGRYSEAIEVLKVGLSTHGDRTSLAHNACWLAVAEARLGNERGAEQYLAWARQLDPSCYSLADATS